MTVRKEQGEPPVLRGVVAEFGKIHPAFRLKLDPLQKDTLIKDRKTVIKEKAEENQGHNEERTGTPPGLIPPPGSGPALR